MTRTRWDRSKGLPEGVTEKELDAGEAYLDSVEFIKIRCPQCFPVNHGLVVEAEARDPITTYTCNHGHTWNQPHKEVIHK